MSQFYENLVAELDLANTSANDEDKQDDIDLTLLNQLADFLRNKSLLPADETNKTLDSTSQTKELTDPSLLLNVVRDIKEKLAETKCLMGLQRTEFDEGFSSLISTQKDIESKILTQRDELNQAKENFSENKKLFYAKLASLVQNLMKCESEDVSKLVYLPT